MATLQSVGNITELPSKVLEHIFSYLPLYARKHVSLVCRSWEELAFTRSYLRRVSLQLIDYHSTPLTEYGILCDSPRAYSDVIFHFGSTNCTVEQFRMVLNLMDRFGASIVSFSCIDHFSAGQLRVLVDKIPNVEHLIVGLKTANDPLNLDFPVLYRLKTFGSMANLLESSAIDIPAVLPSVGRLAAKVLAPDTRGRALRALEFLAPQLKGVEIYATGYYFDISKLHFPRVEEIKLSGKVFDTEECVQRRFFERFSPTLRVLIFKPVDFMLDIVTDRCPLLHTLHLKTENLNPAGHSLRFLNRLRELKVLGLKGPIAESMLHNLYPLPSVERFHLDMIYTCDEAGIFLRFGHLLPNVTKMWITLQERFSLIDKLFPLCTNYPKLRRLHVIGRKCPVRVFFRCKSQKTLAVGEMGLLEELSLNELDVVVKFQVPSKNLKRLELNYVTDVDLVSIIKFCPNLRYFSVYNCQDIRKHVICAIQMFLPDVVVDYNNEHYPDLYE